MGVEHDHDHAGYSHSDDHNGLKNPEVLDDNEVVITQVRTIRNKKRKKSENFEHEDEEETLPMKKKKNAKKQDCEKRAKRSVRI